MIRVIYDGQCPLCRTYVRATRLRAVAGEITLIDARSAPDEVNRLHTLGLHIDDGIVVEINNICYHGAPALHQLALLSTRSGVFNRVAYWAFCDARRAALLYPALRLGRNTLLKVLGRRPVES